MLTVGLTTYSGESVTLNYALETFTPRSTDNIYELDVIHDVLDRDGVSELDLSREVCRKFDKLALRSGSCLFEMPLKRRAGVYFLDFVIGKLYSGITIFFNCTDLRDNTRTSLDDSAWNVLSISTENGSHSDFLSN